VLGPMSARGQGQPFKPSKTKSRAKRLLSRHSRSQRKVSRQPSDNRPGRYAERAALPAAIGHALGRPRSRALQVRDRRRGVAGAGLQARARTGNGSVPRPAA